MTNKKYGQRGAVRIFCFCVEIKMLAVRRRQACYGLKISMRVGMAHMCIKTAARDIFEKRHLQRGAYVV